MSKYELMYTTTTTATSIACIYFDYFILILCIKLYI